jgi:hypothetical protein
VRIGYDGRRIRTVFTVCRSRTVGVYRSATTALIFV